MNLAIRSNVGDRNAFQWFRLKEEYVREIFKAQIVTRKKANIGTRS